MGEFYVSSTAESCFKSLFELRVICGVTCLGEMRPCTLFETKQVQNFWKLNKSMLNSEGSHILDLCGFYFLFLNGSPGDG